MRRINGLTSETYMLWLYLFLKRKVTVLFILRMRRINGLTTGTYTNRPQIRLFCEFTLLMYLGWMSVSGESPKQVGNRWSKGIRLMEYVERKGFVRSVKVSHLHFGLITFTLPFVGFIFSLQTSDQAQRFSNSVWKATASSTGANPLAEL